MKLSKCCFLIIAVTLAVNPTGCKKNAGFNNAREMVSSAQNDIHIISAEEFRGIMGKGEDYKLIDCREPDELKTGYMPGAVNIPRGMLEFDITQTFPLRNMKIFIYCNTGDRSALAAATLMEMKYSDVTSIAGGWDAWASKYPDKIEKESGKAKAGQTIKEEPVSDGGSCGG